MENELAAAPLSFDWFKPLQGQAFGLQAGEAMLALVLDDVVLQRPNGGGEGRLPPFSLIFEGTPGRLCPQGIYRMHQEAVGTFDIFLVPIGRNPDDMYRYQAVFA